MLFSLLAIIRVIGGGGGVVVVAGSHGDSSIILVAVVAPVARSSLEVQAKMKGQLSAHAVRRLGCWWQSWYRETNEDDNVWRMCRSDEGASSLQASPWYLVRQCEHVQLFGFQRTPAKEKVKTQLRHARIASIYEGTVASGNQVAPARSVQYEL